MSQVLELEVNVDDGDAARDGQDDDVTAQNLLRKEENLIISWIKLSQVQRDAVVDNGTSQSPNLGA